MAKERSEQRTGGGQRRMDVEERKALILNAARELYARAAYSQVSTTEISRASGSSQALVFHYFGTKADLFAAVVGSAIEDLRSAQSAVDADLPDGVPVRDRVRASIEVYLDHIARHPVSWAAPLRGGTEPEEAQKVRAAARAEYVGRLGSLLGVSGWPRHVYALWGYFGFLDQACLHWVEQGCLDDERQPLIESALGALEGALGDWQT
ncbi:TetR/AcrR family transcriptional regulator [Propionibacterium sp. oral taxon 192]|uniref:TetR/AcrR family transcriptional regulator n=1 Tax=Propionibacterium sp. oral taxon 192 TaxID=671222 RepID=UPI00055D04FE|nr:TetR/AcrR family transcriptional regulator [Propionibacterium sp. oral taxon 192]